MMTNSSPNHPTVTLAQGKVIGTIREEKAPQSVEAFLGVPYALPPVGPASAHPTMPHLVSINFSFAP